MVKNAATRSTVLLLCLCFAGTLWGYDRVTDSIRLLLQHQKTDVDRVILLNQFAESQIDKNTNYAIEVAVEAQQLAEKIGDIIGRGKALNVLSWAYYRKGDYTNAFDVGLKGLKLNDSIQHLPQLAIAYRNIASVYNSQANYPLSIEYFLKDLLLHQQLRDTRGIGRALNNLAFTYFKNKDLPKAKEHIKRALANNKYLGDDYLLAFTYRNFGEIYETEKKYDSAAIFYDEAIQHARVIKNNFLLETSLFRKARLYSSLGRDKEAIQILKEAELVSKNLGSKSSITQTYKLLAKVLYNVGDYREAYRIQSAYATINDTLYEERNRSKLALLQASFETEKKQAEIESLNKERKLQKEALRNQLMISVLLGVLVLLITIMLFIIWRRNEFKKKTNRQLTEQKRILEETSILKDKIFSIISHDLRSPIASLTAVLPLLDRNSLNEEVFDTIKKNLGKQLNALNFTIDNLLIWARSQWKGNTPPEKTVFKLSAITDHVVGLLKPTADQKKILLTCSVSDQLLVWADKQHIDIIIRNLVLNAIKFTNEKGVIAITAQAIGDAVEISVTDNGIGMSPLQQSHLFELKTHFTTPGTQKEKGTGLGLLICKDFAELNGSKLSIKSETGEGTIVSFTLPKQSNE